MMIIRAAWTVLAALAFDVFDAASAQKQEKPNIVLIVADDLDADELGVTAQETGIWPTNTGAGRLGLWTKKHDPNVLTPHIDSLARDGVLMTKYHVSNTQCTGNRYAMLTGRQATRGEDLLNHFPVGTLVNLGWEAGILRNETNVAKSLQALGYRTGIIGKWHNIPENEYAKRRLPLKYRPDHLPNANYSHTRSVHGKLKAHYDAHVAYLKDGFGWDVVDRMEWGNSIVNLQWQAQGAVEFIKESANKSPFFLYAALPVPHGQYFFSFNDLESYDDRVTSRGIITNVPKVLPPVFSVNARTKAAGVKKANAMATRMDDYVGVILRELKDLGLSDNTLVMFTSDHASRGKNGCYSGGAHVPFIARWPRKIRKNTRVDSLVASVDLAPTIIDAAGGTAPADMIDGISFKPVMLGQPEPKNFRSSIILEAQTTRAVVTKKWSYIANRVTPEIAKAMAKRPGKVFWSGVDHHNYDNELMYPAYWDADQLYNLETDLYQQVNLVADKRYSGKLKSLRAELHRYIATTLHSFGEFGKGGSQLDEGGSQLGAWTTQNFLEFTESEGYAKGSLKASDDWVGTLENYMVHPAGRGYLQLPKRRHARNVALMKAGLPLSNRYEVVLDFKFVRRRGKLDKEQGVLMAEIKERLKNGKEGSKLGISLMRSRSGDIYLLRLENSMSSEAWKARGTDINEDLLGFGGTKNAAQSDQLRLTFKVQRGSKKTDWRVTSTMENLDNEKVVSILTHTLDSSQDFYTDDILFTAINSVDSEDSSLLLGRTVQKITARS